ncbi:MAG: T9SS type A sorting domain-containing protein [bacterium]
MKRINHFLSLVTVILFQIIGNINISAQPGYNSESPATVAGTHYLHTSLASNIVDNYSYLDNPLTNGNPNALIIIEQNWNPGGSGGTYNPANVGVWYDGSQWAIFNQNLAAMPENSAFNISIVPPSNPNGFIHTTDASNINSHLTYITNPLLDGNPDAVFLVTPNWNPGGVGGTYNDHSIGIWFDGIQWTIFNQDFAAMPENASFNIFVMKNSTEAIIHTSTVSNTSTNYTLIDHPQLNGNPNAQIYTTQNWNPLGVYNAASTGVWYSNSAQKWSIFNEDNISPLPEGASFNVYFGSPQFVHTAAANNLQSDLTLIDHPLLNNNDAAFLFVTHNYNPDGAASNYHNKAIGVYDNGNAWGIYNQDATEMPEGITFNVAIAPLSDNVFRHTTNATNITANWTALDHSALNGNTSARIFVTPVYVSLRHIPTIGVYYNGSNWAVFNQDISLMPEASDFNVMIGDDINSFTHIASAENTFGNYTVIDDARINGSPDAILIVTQNWNYAGVYNNHEVGIWYTGSNWSVYNEDMTDLPENAAFNIHIAEPGDPVTSVEEAETTIPTTFNLEQNYPNPFNPTTVISYQLSVTSNVELKIYDILGREMATLVNEIKSPGHYEVNFNGDDLSSGIYFYKIQAGEFSAVRKMMLLK